MVGEMGLGDKFISGRMADMDFSQVNLQYLMQARDLARQMPDAGALLLDIPASLVCRLANLTPTGLARITDCKMPLVSPRLDAWWWDRLLRAMTDGKPGELQVILEHAGLVTDSTVMQAMGGKPA